jgi:digeranylgeranylglycerophospholipid reductase
MQREFDVIIAGGSFAGLAVASRLQGDVLVLDHEPIGAQRHSACGTFLSVPQTLGLEAAVLDAKEQALIHAPGVPAFQLDEQLCTLDYRSFCEGFVEQSAATFVRASVRTAARTCDGFSIETDQGRFYARQLVDATGWRARVASSLSNQPRDHSGLSYGLETTAEYEADRFYFWLDRATIANGVAWIFPTGARSRIGLASYEGTTVKAQQVRDFMHQLDAGTTEFAGGYYTNKLREPVVSGVFVVGDAAGHCLPLTGEGIRPALYFGQRCGDLLQQVIDGATTREQALADYRLLVRRFRRHYAALRVLQRELPRLPAPAMRPLLRLLERPRIYRWPLRRYLELMQLEPPIHAGATAGPPSASTLLSREGFRA